MMPISVLHHDVSLDLIIFLKIIKLLKYKTALVSAATSFTSSLKQQEARGPSKSARPLS